MQPALLDVPPDDLAVSIRAAVARVGQDWGWQTVFNRCVLRLELLFLHVVEPLLIPVMGGAMVALIVFAFVFPILGDGLYGPRTVPDLPTSLMQPARLETLPGFEMPGLGDNAAGNHDLLVEATVSAAGQSAR